METLCAPGCESWSPALNGPSVCGCHSSLSLPIQPPLSIPVCQTLPAFRGLPRGWACSHWHWLSNATPVTQATPTLRMLCPGLESQTGLQARRELDRDVSVGVYLITEQLSSYQCCCAGPILQQSADKSSQLGYCQASSTQGPSGPGPTARHLILEAADRLQ